MEQAGTVWCSALPNSKAPYDVNSVCMVFSMGEAFIREQTSGLADRINTKVAVHTLRTRHRVAHGRKKSAARYASGPNRDCIGARAK